MSWDSVRAGQLAGEKMMRKDENEIRRELDLANVCDGNMMKLVTSHSQAIGVPKEYIFFPLLSTVSAFMGQSCIVINDEWRESCCLWTAVVARRGTRRSTTIDRLSSALAQLADDSNTARIGGSIEVLPDVDLGANIYSNCLKRASDSSRFFGLFEDIVSSKIMDNAACSMQCAKKLYGGPSYTYEGQAIKANSSLSLFTFLPPNDIGSVLDIDCVDVCSRLLVSCPKTLTFKSQDLKSPMPSNTPSLKKIFEVLQVTHVQPHTYQLSPAAKAVFDQYHDTLQDGMLRYESDERNYCILSKAAGQLARVASVIVAMRQALKTVVYWENVSHAAWNVEITLEDIEAAKLIMDYSIDIRFALLTRLNAFKASANASLMVGPHPFSTPIVNASLSSAAQQSDPPSVKRVRLSNEQGLPFAASTMSQVVPAALNPPATSNIMAPAPVNTTQTTTLPAFTHAFNVKAHSVNTSLNTTPLTATNEPTPENILNNSTSFPWAASNDDDMPTPGRRGYIDTTVLTDDDLQGYTEEQKLFIRKYGYKVKKLLEFKLDHRVSPSACAQRHLMPPIPRSEMGKYDTQTRYPVMAAKEYLAKVADLGLGTIEASWSSINNRKSMHFVKFTYDQLGDKSKDLCVKLQVDRVDYVAGFNNVLSFVPKQEVPTSAGRYYFPLTPTQNYLQGAQTSIPLLLNGDLCDDQHDDQLNGGSVFVPTVAKTEPFEIQADDQEL